MTKYLVCDLDDCLIKTDTLYEQWLALLKYNPLDFLLSFLWLFKGKAYFKSQISKRTRFCAEILPYRADVLQILRDFKKNEKDGLILASASPAPWVEAVALHLGLFDKVIASTDRVNFKGAAKLQALKSAIGDSSVAYIGDHMADLELWKHADEIIAVNASRSLRARIGELKKPTRFIDDIKKSKWCLLTKQIRPHQWVKNVLVFLPALAGHKVGSADILLQGFLAFAGFSFSASFVYVLNDLLDLPADRNHQSKKNRPFASGDLSIKWGILLLPILLFGVGIFASFLNADYAIWMLAYLLLNLAYSMSLKQTVVVDVIILSMMYTLRIFAGSAATQVPVSEWLLSFSTLFFFSLACIKRYTEIIRSKTKITLDGRGYRQVDHAIIQNLGAGTGLLSIVIIMMYLQGKEVRALYSHPESLWYTNLILLYWVSRIWLLASRDEIHDDPVVFAVKDRPSWICLALIGIIFGFSI